MVILIQFHREDGPFGSLAGDLASEFGCSAPFGLHSPPNKVRFCHPVTFDETEGGVGGLCVKLMDPEDCVRMWLVGPDIPPNRVLYRGIGAVIYIYTYIYIYINICIYICMYIYIYLCLPPDTLMSSLSSRWFWGGTLLSEH